MVGEVISNEDVEQLVVAVEVGGGDGDQLAITRCRGARRGSGEQVAGVIGEQRRRYQPVDEGVIGHDITVGPPADDELTRR